MAGKYTYIAPVTIGASGVDLVPDPGDGYRGVLVEVGLYNGDSETRSVTISDGTTTFRKFSIPAGEGIEVWLPEEFGLQWVGAESAAITATASAADVVEITGGRWTKRQVR